MEPNDSSGLPAWRQAAVVVILGGLAAALIWQVSRDPVPLPPTPTAVSMVTAPSVTDVIRTTVAEATTPPPPTSVTPAASAADEAELLERAGQALDAWGRFAVSGDLAVLDPWFAPEGPQYQQLVSESAALQEAPLGDPPYSVALAAPEVSYQNDSAAEVAGTVTFSRAGEAAQAFAWRLQFRQTPDGWALWSVEPS